MASKKAIRSNKIGDSTTAINRTFSSETMNSTAKGEKHFDAVSTTTGHSSISRIHLKGCCVDDPRTPEGRRNQMTKVITMTGIPIIMLLVQTGLAVQDALQEQAYASAFVREVLFAVQAGAVVHALGLERGTSTFFVSAGYLDSLYKPVLVRRGMVDKALADMNTWPAEINSDDQSAFQNKQDLYLQIMINRLFVNSSTPETQLSFFSSTINILLKWIGDAVVRSQAKEQRWQDLVGYHLFISAKEAYAAERSAGTVLYGRGNMSLKTYLWYHNQRDQADGFLNKSLEYKNYIKQQLIKRWYSSELRRNITIERALIDENTLGKPNIPRGNFWYSQMSTFQNILYDIETNLTTNITDNLNSAVANSALTASIQLFIAAFSIALFPAIISLLTHITGQIQNFAGVLQAKNDEVMLEKKRAETVLNHLLPRQIAEKVKLGQPIYPESYDQVTIFFSDIVSFTDFSSASTPLQVVDTLNRLYTVMDRRIDAYDVYKVETIGDAYLCASGLPDRNGNKHSFEVASMALELVPDVSTIRIPHKPDYHLRLRIGLHSGPCVAGIIGTKMPRYCIFGDTVNTASRMESNGEALKIHISTATHDALTAFDVFEMEKRGEIQIKGKGLMTTYWLVAKREGKRKLFGPDVHG